jgi:hypothetical protein
MPLKFMLKAAVLARNSEVLLKNHVVTYKKAKKTGGRNNQKELAVSIGSTFLDTLTILFGYDLVAKY